jgi:hypothetical protein
MAPPAENDAEVEDGVTTRAPALELRPCRSGSSSTTPRPLAILRAQLTNHGALRALAAGARVSPLIHGGA